MDKAKPFKIPKREVWEAFKRVKANQGAAGVDGQSIAEFEANLSGSLYKLWNRLSSGSYFPPPVRRIEIPKANGGTRPLGIPTVADRIAQEVVRRYLELLTGVCSALAQSTSPLVGTWNLVSYHFAKSDGTATDPMGTDPVGRLIYDARGCMFIEIMRKERPRSTAANRRKRPQRSCQ